MQSSIFPLSIFCILASSACGAILKTDISAGTIQGAKCSQNDATAFQAIPYAQPPIGNLRFAAPKAFEGKFDGSFLNATKPAPSCIQFGLSFVEKGQTSEDCLYLDVWVPPNATQSSKLPVKVWLYGGGDDAGGISDPAYNGCNLAMDNTLVVSINYRLGPLGFFALDTAGIKGNQAIQDMLLGLQWVQDNIGFFGGDPKQVLLFGQSAGADNTFILSTLPQAPQLFKAAIPESGGGRSTALAAGTFAFGATFAAALNCSVHDPACLRATSVSTLNNTLGSSANSGIPGSPIEGFAPYVDGTIIPTQPSTTGVRVPTMFGSTSMEGTLFILSEYGPRYPNLTNTDYLQFLSTQFAPSIAPLVAQKFPLAAFNNTPYPAFFALANIITDAAFKCPAYRGLKTAAAKGVPVYTYLDAHTPSCSWLPGIPVTELKLLGATHSAELPFVFGQLTGLEGETGSCNLTSSEARISEALIGAWSAMASRGDPSSSGFQWPRFSVEESVGVVISETAQVGVVDYSVCEFWDEIAAMSEKLGTGVGEGNFSSSANASATNATSGGNGTFGAGGATASSVASFTGAATRTLASSMLSLTGFAVAVVMVLVLF